MRQTKIRIAIILLACGLFVAALAFSPRVTAPSTGTLSLSLAALAAAAPPPVTLCNCYFSTDCKGRHVNSAPVAWSKEKMTVVASS